MFEQSRPKFSDKLIQTHFDDIEQIAEEHLRRIPKIVTLPDKRPPSDMGWKSGVLLVRFLLRSYITIRESAQAIEQGLVILSYQGARAELENVAVMSILYSSLKSHYDGNMTLQQLIEKLGRLFIGTRYPGHIHDDPNVNIKPINVLTAVENLDRLIEKTSGKKFLFNERPAVMDIYNWLSEFCHPSCLGLSFGYEIDVDDRDVPTLVEQIDPHPSFQADDLVMTTLALCTGRFVVDWFCELWQLLISHNEVMPELCDRHH